MPVQSDHWIGERALNRGPIDRFSEERAAQGAMFYGLSCHGSDRRISDEVKKLAKAN